MGRPVVIESAYAYERNSGTSMSITRPHVTQGHQGYLKEFTDFNPWFVLATIERL
jgi:hypothetical protein